MTNKKIFITGGAGFLGKALIARFYDNNEIVVYSRDEAKHYYLKKQYPKIRTVIGDVRDLELSKRAAQGCDYAIFAASLKQIEACDSNVSEATETIIRGSINGRLIAEELGMIAATFISSDKSRAPTTIYGALKFVAGESFIVNSENSKTNLTTLVYGNVLNSTGSIIPLIWDHIKRNKVLSLYHAEMTRFSVHINEAVDLVEKTFNNQIHGYTIAPYLKGFIVKDLFDIFKEKFGLQYIVTSPRIGEKIHEEMICTEESPRVKYDPNLNIFLIHPKTVFEKNEFFPLKTKNFSSDSNLMSRKDLTDLLEWNDFFKP